MQHCLQEESTDSIVSLTVVTSLKVCLIGYLSGFAIITCHLRRCTYFAQSVLNCRLCCSSFSETSPHLMWKHAFLIALYFFQFLMRRTSCPLKRSLNSLQNCAASVGACQASVFARTSLVCHNFAVFEAFLDFKVQGNFLVQMLQA